MICGAKSIGKHNTGESPEQKVLENIIPESRPRRKIENNIISSVSATFRVQSVVFLRNGNDFRAESFFEVRKHTYFLQTGEIAKIDQRIPRERERFHFLTFLFFRLPHFCVHENNVFHGTGRDIFRQGQKNDFYDFCDFVICWFSL